MAMAAVCDGLTGGSALVNSTNDPNQFRFCDQAGSRYQDLGKNVSIPFRHEFKLSGNYPLLYGLEFGTILQSYPGDQRVITWTPAAGVFPGGQRTNSETIVLTRPGSMYQPRDRWPGRFPPHASRAPSVTP